MALQFSNKVVIVTGASSGFGEVISEMFASRGAKVTLCGRDESRLHLVYEKVIQISGGHRDNFLIVQGDITDHRVRKQIVDRTVAKFGRLDILVANAGILGTDQTILTATEETFDAVIDINLKSAFFLIQEAVPHLEKTKGNIINMSSVISGMSVPALTICSMSKIALDHLTRCLATELGPKGIRANTINPGHIGTNLLQNANITDESMSEFTIIEKEKQVLCDRLGTPEDVAEAVAFLASDAAGFITGESIRLDGGRIFNGGIDTSVLKRKN